MSNKFNSPTYINPVESTSDHSVENKKTAIRILAMYEGRKTEPQYFQNFVCEHKSVGIVEPVNLKSSFEQDLTDRLLMVRSANSEYLYRMGKLTFYKGISIIFDEYYQKIVNQKLSKDHELNKKLQELREKVYKNSKYKAQKELIIDKGENVISSKKLIVSIVDELNAFSKRNKIDYEYSFSKTSLVALKEQDSVYEDHYYIVYDRDWNKDPRLPYKYVKACSEATYLQCKNECIPPIKILMTTPLFEYWLMMHDNTANYWDIDPDLSSKPAVFKAILNYEKDAEYLKHKDDWDDQKVVDYYEDTKKGMDKERYNNYKNAYFQVAVKNSKDPRLSRTYSNLLTNIGTQLAEELEELLHRGG